MIVFSGPKSAVRFGTKEALTKYVFTEKGRTSTLLSGFGAGIAEAILAVTPGETMKTKLIHDFL